MFTGIIEEVGRVQSISSNKINIKANTVLNETKIGDSISVNGVCLTVTAISDGNFTADISPETFKVTALKNLTSGMAVNLERALPANGRFGGHIVTGHIDGIGKIKKLAKNSDFYDFEIELSRENAKYVVKKGSIAINGISLTIAEVHNNTVLFAVIPHTFENTNLKNLKTGDYINVETDILAKYIENFLSTGDNRTGIDMEFLQRNGF